MAKERKQGGGSRRSKPKSASETMPTAAEPEGAASGATAPANATPAGAQPGTVQPPPGSARTKADRPVQFSIPAELVEHILLGPIDDRRVLQDSPLLGDVWAAYALDPGVVQDVLITPHKKATAAVVAQMIPLGIGAARAGAPSRRSAAVQAAESKSEGRLSARPRGCEAVFRRSAAHPCAPDTMVEPVEDSGKNIEDRPG